jgi:hypothetical protein
MRRVFLALLTGLTCLAVATDANEVIRSKDETYKPLLATKVQADALHRIEDRYTSQLTKLRKDKPNDYLIQRDTLNEKFTKEFMLGMTPIQKSTYRKYIRSLRQGYRKAHPDVDADNIFIWGGANLL